MEILFFCGGGTSSTIATVPSGGSSTGYQAMGAAKTLTHGVVLVLASYAAHGLWLCYGATNSGCASQSAFITLPSAFCSTMKVLSVCLPNGAALDKSLNFYYVDGNNKVLVECTASSGYQSCSVLLASSALSGFPVGLHLKGTTFYVDDASCSGKVWKGTKSSLALIATLNEELNSITTSTKNPLSAVHIYVGYSGLCTKIPAHVYDLTDKKSLPSPFPAGALIYGLDAKLQIASYTNLTTAGAAYQTADSS